MVARIYDGSMSGPDSTELQTRLTELVQHPMVRSELDKQGRFTWFASGIAVWVVSDSDRWLRSEEEEFVRELLRVPQCKLTVSSRPCKFALGHAGACQPKELRALRPIEQNLLHAFLDTIPVETVPGIIIELLPIAFQFLEKRQP
jgi:hypothetical protein